MLTIRTSYSFDGQQLKLKLISLIVFASFCTFILFTRQKIVVLIFLTDISGDFYIHRIITRSLTNRKSLRVVTNSSAFTHRENHKKLYSGSPGNNFKINNVHVACSHRACLPLKLPVVFCERTLIHDFVSLIIRDLTVFACTSVPILLNKYVTHKL